MINGLQKALTHLSQVLRDDATETSSARRDGDRWTSMTTPNWHGDHWQNLLACPMDARRYILEDWSQTQDASSADGDETRVDSFSGRRVRAFH